MTTAFDPRHPAGSANAFPAAGFPPAVFETVAGSMMRVAEAEFALLQAIMQAQFGMMEAMMRAGAPMLPRRSVGDAPSRSAASHPSGQAPT